MIKRILFPTDFSESAIRAQKFVLELARREGASVEVLHAIEPVPSPDEPAAFDDFYRELERRADALFTRVVEAFREAKVPCSTKVVIDKRWRAIVRRAESESMDLIVMGSRKPTPQEGPAGTTSHKVFLAASVPVLFVR